MDISTGNKPILVCGSVHLSIIAKTRKASVGLEKDGQLFFDIGGTALNIATAIRDLGMRPRLLTALPRQSPFAKIIQTHLESMGIDLRIQLDSEMSDGGTCVHVDMNGQVTSSVSIMPIETVKLYRDIYEPAIDGAAACILDTSMSAEVIAHIGRYANEKGIPVFACVTSEEKGTRITGLDVTFSAVFANEREVEAMSGGDVDTDSAITLSRRLHCPVVVTRGKNGAIIAMPDSASISAVGTSEIDHELNKDFLGAGDALAAHTITHVVHGRRKLRDALSIAMCAAEEVAINRHAELSESGGKMCASLFSLSNAASIDHLTSLPNRATANHKLQQLHDRNANFFVALIDVDNFKLINDSMGHDVGDEALQLISSTIAKTMRESDFCARWGGEEFLCIISRGAQTTAETKAIMERTRMAIEALSWRGRGLSVSIGIGQFAGSIEATIKSADIALYQAKKNGRNRIEV